MSEEHREQICENSALNKKQSEKGQKYKSGAQKVLNRSHGSLVYVTGKDAEFYPAIECQLGRIRPLQQQQKVLKSIARALESCSYQFMGSIMFALGKLTEYENVNIKHR